MVSNCVEKVGSQETHKQNKRPYDYTQPYGHAEMQEAAPGNIKNKWIDGWCMKSFSLFQLNTTPGELGYGDSMG